MENVKDSEVQWIGKIPYTWNVTRNKNVFICDKRLVGSNSSATQLLSLTTKGIKTKDINNAEGKLPESFDTYQFVSINDIVMCLFDLDMSAVFSGISLYEGMISPAYKVITCKENIIPQYADYWFRYIFDGRKFKHYAKNIRYTLNYEDFSALPILQPPMSVQHRIVYYLDNKCSKIDSLIEKQQKAIEKLTEYKLSVITETVTKGLGQDKELKDSGTRFIGYIPYNWTVSKLKYMSLAIGDGIHGTPEYDSEGEIYFVNGNNIGAETLVFKADTNTINETEFKKYKKPLLNDNTILMTLNGATYGKTSFYSGEQILLGKSAGYITLKPNENKEFVRYYLQSTVAKLIMDYSLCGSTIANVSLRTLNDFTIPYPPKAEQVEIVRYLDKHTSRIDKSINCRQSIVERLIEYKKSLIYEVVTGKKEV